jgi:dTMP kinase
MFGIHSQRGAFIVFEGCDRAGKSTQCKKLVQALCQKNIEAEYMCFPGNNSILVRQKLFKYS